MTADNILFRCSSLGHLMTEPRSKSAILSDTTITHLIDVFVSEKYGRREEITSKFLDKGNAREEDAITLLSRVTKRFFKKNSVRMANEFVKGEPDLFLGESIENADETFDTKSSWSAHTFFRAKNADLNKMYYWQGIGYMWLTGARKHTVAYCLVNGTPEAITAEKRRLAWSMNLVDPTLSPAYKEKCKQIEINHIFDLQQFMDENPFFELDNDPAEWNFDIRKEDRVYMVSFDRNDDEIARLAKRISDCRSWMNENLFKVSFNMEKQWQ